MKHIVLFIIIIIVFILLGLIIINKLEMCSYNNQTKQSLITEHFETSAASAIETATKKDLDGGYITLHNIAATNTSNLYVRADNNRVVSCINNDGCSTGFTCITEDDEKECKRDTGKKGYELVRTSKSYIELPVINSGQYTVENFSFSFNFILKNATTKKYLISTKSNRWCLYNNKGDLYLAVLEKTQNSDGDDVYTEAEAIKINTDPIFSYQMYGCTVNTFKDKVSAKLNSLTGMKEIYYKDIECSDDLDCETGTCNGDLGDKKCVLNNETYYFGRYKISDGNFKYLDGYMGEFKILLTKIQCDFYGKTYKNKRKCLEACAQTQCLTTTCNSECNTVPTCEFNTMGRHSIDCIQHCIKNIDCDAEFCKKKCEGSCGGSGCPWQQKQDVESYDSQYYDKDGKPSAVIITLANTSTDGTKVTMKWRPAYQGKLPVLGYMSYLYKTFKKADAVKINKINLSICNEYCEYVITELEPNETYTFGIKAYNEIGLSQMSNLVTFKAEVTSLTFDLNIDYEVDENDVGSFNYCEDV